MALFPRVPVSALYSSEVGAYIVPEPGRAYDEHDPLVKEHRSAFGTAEEVEADRRAADAVVFQVPVESATAEPGRKRETRRQ